MHKKQMLVVDDNRGLREALRLVFEENYELLFAADGENAIKVVYEHKPEVVLMDYKMPGLDGVETMEILRRISPDTQMIMMSAWDDRETVANCFRGGACDFVGKPFELHEIQTVVGQAADKCRKPAQLKHQPKVKNSLISQNEINELIDETLRVACV